MILVPMLHGKHKNGLQKWRKASKIVNAVWISCNSGQRNCNSEILRWKLVVSGLHFLLYVCSETHIFKMSQKCAGTHIENCAFRLGRIAKLEKCKKWSSKISFDRKQPKRATTKNQASVNQRKTPFHCNFTAKTERHVEGFVRPREPWSTKKQKKRFAPYVEICFPWSMGSKIMIKIALKR